jgi:hypothetical protein
MAPLVSPCSCLMGGLLMLHMFIISVFSKHQLIALFALGGGGYQHSTYIFLPNSLLAGLNPSTLGLIGNDISKHKLHITFRMLIIKQVTLNKSTLSLKILMLNAQTLKLFTMKIKRESIYKSK